jgi:hypothetical protein
MDFYTLNVLLIQVFNYFHHYCLDTLEDHHLYSTKSKYFLNLLNIFIIFIKNC